MHVWRTEFMSGKTEFMSGKTEFKFEKLNLC